MATTGKDKKGRIKSPVFKLSKASKVKTKALRSSKKDSSKETKVRFDVSNIVATGAARNRRGLQNGGTAIDPLTSLDVEDPGIDPKLLRQDSRELNAEVASGINPVTPVAGLVGNAADAAERFNQSGRKSSLGVTAGTGALKGAAKGAAIGSIIPGVGTAIGAGVGAVAGGLAGFFKGKEAKRAQAAQANVEAVQAQSVAFSRDANKAVTPGQEIEAEKSAAGEFSLASRLGRVFARGGNVLSSEKAKKILTDGKIRGKALSTGQKGLFGLIAGGDTPDLANGGKVTTGLVARGNTSAIFKTKEGEIITGAPIKGKTDTATILSDGKAQDVTIPARKEPTPVEKRLAQVEFERKFGKKAKGGFVHKLQLV